MSVGRGLPAGRGRKEHPSGETPLPCCAGAQGPSPGEAGRQLCPGEGRHSSTRLAPLPMKAKWGASRGPQLQGHGGRKLTAEQPLVEEPRSAFLGRQSSLRVREAGGKDGSAASGRAWADLEAAPTRHPGQPAGVSPRGDRTPAEQGPPTPDPRADPREPSLNTTDGDFPGGPGLKTARFPCRGHGFDPWLGN